MNLNTQDDRPHICVRKEYLSQRALAMRNSESNYRTTLVCTSVSSVTNDRKADRLSWPNQLQ